MLSKIMPPKTYPQQNSFAERVKNHLHLSLSGSLCYPLQNCLAFLAFQEEFGIMKNSLVTISEKSQELMFLISGMKSSKGITFACLLIAFQEAPYEVFSEGLGKREKFLGERRELLAACAVNFHSFCTCLANHIF